MQTKYINVIPFINLKDFTKLQSNYNNIYLYNLILEYLLMLHNHQALNCQQDNLGLFNQINKNFLKYLPTIIMYQGFINSHHHLYQFLYLQIILRSFSYKNLCITIFFRLFKINLFTLRISYVLNFRPYLFTTFIAMILIINCYRFQFQYQSPFSFLYLKGLFQSW